MEGTSLRTLAIPGFAQPLRLRCVDRLSLADGLLLVEEEHEDLTGLQVWPGAHLLLQFLASRPELWRERGAGTHAVELGCGTGAVGLALASQLVSLVLTDGHASVVELAAANAALNCAAAPSSSSKVEARPLLWGDGPEAAKQLEGIFAVSQRRAFDLVLAADVIYDAEVVAPLLWTAARLLGSPSLSKEEEDETASPPPAAAAAGTRPPTFLLSYVGRCLLPDAEFDRRVMAAGQAVGLRLAAIVGVDAHPELAAPLEAAVAETLRESDAWVYVFERG